MCDLYVETDLEDPEEQNGSVVGKIKIRQSSTGLISGAENHYCTMKLKIKFYSYVF